MMKTAIIKLPLIERAFEIARSGPIFGLKDVRSQLKREGYDLVDSHVDGTLAKQLRQICKSASAAALDV